MTQLLELFWSFTQIGFCSFGGLSMIPLINAEMQAHNWLTAAQVADIVAIAEMTPGSLGVNCATFVGMQIDGLVGALVATIGSMMPSLTLCVVAAQFIKKFKDSRQLQNILYGVRPACFGMIVAIIFPMWRTNYFIADLFRWELLIIAAIALILLMKYRWSIPKVIGVSAVLGLLLVR